MNATTEYRTTRVRQRVEKLQRRRDQKFLATILLICTLLVIALYFVFNEVTQGSKSISMMTDFGGAVLLNQSGGGYVLIGLLAFVAGVAVTSLCIHFRTIALMRETVDLQILQTEDINDESDQPL